MQWEPYRGGIGCLVFVVFVAASIYSETLGLRLAGLFLVSSGTYAACTRALPYGWRGGPTVGTLRGIPAVAIAVLIICFGLFILLKPEVVASWGRYH